MKRLKDLLTEREAFAKETQIVFIERMNRLLKETENVPLYSPPPTSRGDYNEIRTKLRAKAAEGEVLPLNIACDYCGYELVNREPGTILLSNPARISIGCVACGWIGSMPR